MYYISVASAEMVSKPPSAKSLRTSDLMAKLVRDVAAIGSGSLATTAGKGPNGTDSPTIFYTPAPSEKYICCVCNNVLRRPVKFESCGHCCCSVCFTELMA